MTRGTVACIAACLIPAAATAQPPAGTAPATPQTQGPMIVERVRSGFVVAPDFKITEVDRETSGLAGGYAGRLTDDRFFIGGGGYWLANQASDRRMAYGGLVLQWLEAGNRRIGFGAKGLLGIGHATLGATVPRFTATPGMTNGPRPGQTLVNTRVRYERNFLVAEPEADLVLKLTHRLHLTAGVGYRFTNVEGRSGGDNERLRGTVGTVGSIALQIGGGS